MYWHDNLKCQFRHIPYNLKEVNSDIYLTTSKKLIQTYTLQPQRSQFRHIPYNLKEVNSDIYLTTSKKSIQTYTLQPQRS